MHNIICQERKEKERLQKELTYLRQDLTKLALDVKLNNEFNEQIHRYLHEIYHLKDANKRLQRIRELMRTTGDQVRVNGSFKMLRLNVKELSSAFFSRLEEAHPELTRTEKELCGFIRLGMQTKDVAAIRGVSVKSIEMARYRLRKKLQLASHTDLKCFVERY